MRYRVRYQFHQGWGFRHVEADTPDNAAFDAEVQLALQGLRDVVVIDVEAHPIEPEDIRQRA